MIEIIDGFETAANDELAEQQIATCPNCGLRQPRTRKKCRKCGKKLAVMKPQTIGANKVILTDAEIKQISPKAYRLVKLAIRSKLKTEMHSKRKWLGPGLRKIKTYYDISISLDETEMRTLHDWYNSLLAKKGYFISMECFIRIVKQAQDRLIGAEERTVRFERTGMLIWLLITLLTLEASSTVNYVLLGLSVVFFILSESTLLKPKLSDRNRHLYFILASTPLSLKSVMLIISFILYVGYLVI